MALVFSKCRGKWYKLIVYRYFVNINRAVFVPYENCEFSQKQTQLSYSFVDKCTIVTTWRL